METVLRDQWETLRCWLEDADVLDHGHGPSVLPGWTVRDLVAHLGFGIVMLDEVEVAPSGTEPLPIGRYIAQYPPAARTIQAATRELATDLDDVLEGIDRLASRAWGALDRGLPTVVLGRRGPLTGHDFLVTRLVELVVHGDDLQRSLPAHVGTPLLPAATTVVVETLLDAYALRSAERPHVVSAEQWIRIATGRTPSVDPHVPLL